MTTWKELKEWVASEGVQDEDEVSSIYMNEGGDGAVITFRKPGEPPPHISTPSRVYMQPERLVSDDDIVIIIPHDGPELKLRRGQLDEPPWNEWEWSNEREFGDSCDRFIAMRRVP